MKLLSYTCLYMITAIAIFLPGCSDDDVRCFDPAIRTCENYDPCLLAEPAQASMRVTHILEGVLCPEIEPFRRDIAVDTILVGEPLHFMSASDQGLHHWNIDNQVVQTGNELGRVILTGAESRDIQVRLIEEISDPDSCFDINQLQDTIFRTFHLRTWEGTLADAPPIFGRFRGFIRGEENDIFDINFSIPDTGTGLEFPAPCGDLNIAFDYSYRDAIFSTTDDDCTTICGFANVSSNNNDIIITYMEVTDNGIISRTFLGDRL